MNDIEKGTFMVTIDLITGFLGSGKTTFIKKYASHLMEEGMNIGILVNDYGAVNIDMMLLQDLEGDLCELEMVAGGCDAHCHKRRFKTKLIAMAMYGYNRVIVEPSGVFDVDEFFDVLEEDPINRFYQIGSVISLVDAGLEEDLSEQSEYLMLSQTARAGLAVLSKTDLWDKTRQKASIDHVNRILAKNGCEIFTEDRILARSWGMTDDENVTGSRGTSAEEVLAGNMGMSADLKKETKAFDKCDWELVMKAGHRESTHRKIHIEDEGTFKSLYFLSLSPGMEQARDVIRRLFQDSDIAGQGIGHIFRVKGFLQEDEQWYELNASKESLSIRPVSRGQDVFVVIGEGLAKTLIEEYWK